MPGSDEWRSAVQCCVLSAARPAAEPRAARLPAPPVWRLLTFRTPQSLQSQSQQQQQQQLQQQPPIVRLPERERSEREKKPKMVKVRLSVHYRVHSRQMLCIGGSQVSRRASAAWWLYVGLRSAPLRLACQARQGSLLVVCVCVPSCGARRPHLHCMPLRPNTLRVPNPARSLHRCPLAGRSCPSRVYR